MRTVMVHPKTAIRCVAWSAVAIVVVFFLVAEVGITSRQSFETDFFEGHRSFSSLGPPARIGARDAIAGVTSAVGEPVYFDLRVPALTETAEVYVSFDAPDPSKVRLGIVRGGTEDAPTFSLHPLSQIGLEDKMPFARVTVDLRGAPRRDGAVRFFLSAPGTSDDLPLRIHRVRITTIRPTLESIRARAFLLPYRLMKKT